MGDILNRKNKLWHQKFMLPQHQEKLIKDEQARGEIKTPIILDENRLEELNYKLVDAYHSQAAISCQYFRERRINSCHGRIVSIDPIAKAFTLLDGEERIVVQFRELMELQE
jgi:hypothetical protein